MTRLFQRQALAYLLPPGETAESERAVVLKGFRMTFKAERSLKKSPNSLELNVYNLTRATLSRVQQRHTQVELVAGYGGHLARIFKGETRSVLPRREGPDWVANLQCGDGAVAFGYGRTNQSFAPGTSLKDALVGIAKQAKVGVGNAVQAFSKGGLEAGFQAFTHGFTATGDAQSDIDAIVRTAGFSWSIQDGELQLLTDERDTSGTAEVLSSDTGLVGSPQMGTPTKKGGAGVLRVKCLLRPQLRPGVAFQVESEGLRGQFRAERVVHEGDTSGGEWFTTLEARAL